MARCYRTVLDEVCELLQGALDSERPTVQIDFSEAHAHALRLETTFWGELEEPIPRHRLRQIFDAVDARREYVRKLQLLIPRYGIS